MKKSFLGCLLLTVSVIPLLAEQRIVFVVRHAERTGTDGPAQTDPALSETGRARAAGLKRELRDAGIQSIYTSELKRARQTAAPLADSLGIKSEVVAARDVDELITKIKSGAGNVLIVGHSNTVPEIVKGLGVTTKVTLSEKQYDDLFVVVLGQPPLLLHLHYR